MITVRFLEPDGKKSAVFRGYLTLIGWKIRFEKKNSLSVANLWERLPFNMSFSANRFMLFQAAEPNHDATDDSSCLPPTLIEGETFMTMLERKQRLILRGMNIPKKSKDQTLPLGSRESFTWIILKTILCLVLDFQGIYIYMLNGFAMPLEDALLSCGEQ